MKTENQVALIAVSMALDSFQRSLVQQKHSDMKISEACVKTAEELVAYLATYSVKEESWERFMGDMDAKTKKEAVSRWLRIRIGIKS